MSDRLKERLLRRIEREGAITFAEFMEAALYDPEEGFYAHPPVGERAHFVTSPHVSPVFGALVARQLADSWEGLGRPSTFAVVEVGAGDGTLARRVLEATASVPDLARAVRYVAVERSAGARSALRSTGIETADSLEAVDPVTGCVLANEVLDNVPFHRLRRENGKLLEVMVGAEGGRLIEVEAEPSPEVLGSSPALVDGIERPVSPGALELVGGISRVLERGYAFLIDYGFWEGEAPGPVHAYRDQHVLEDVLNDPGSRDVTAAVDLSAVAAEARAAGLNVWGPVSQRDALLALGFRLWIRGVRRGQEDAEQAGEWREANRLFGERSKASILIDDGKLGGLRWLVLGTSGLPAPACVLGDRETGC